VKRLLLLSLVCLSVAACSNDAGTKVRAGSGASTSSTTTTTAPPTTTTAAPSTTTTTASPLPPPTTVAAPTTTTIPADHARLTIVNDYPAGVVVVINGVRYDVAQGGRRGPLAVKPAEQGDSVGIERADDSACGTGTGGLSFFTPGGAFELRVYANGTGVCGSAQRPLISGVVNPGNKQI
jgi:hypothetical protein